MKKSALLCLIIFSTTVQAQVYRDRIGFELESIASMDIGWIKKYTYTTPATAKQSGERKYSAAQIGYSQEFIKWMQQSYSPKGCLGDAGYYLNYIPKFSNTNSRLGNAINSHAKALPQLYGAYSKMYMFLKKDATGKFVPQNNFAEYWHIEANGLQYISKPVSFISSTEEYFFVLPDYKSHPKGYDDEDKVASKLLGFNNHPNTRNYRHFYIPPKIIGDSPHYVVILTKDNELPFEQITIGEFFTQVEKQFPVWQGITPVPAEPLAAAQKNLTRLKEKYKDRMHEIARLKLSATQISLYDFVNATEGYDDFFDNKDIYGNQEMQASFPILKVKKSAHELCKTGGPQWLVIRWTTGMPNQAFNIHLHESILNNFNFEYAHNYFFYPEKVKGQSYKPLRSPTFTEVLPPARESETSKKANADKTTFFFEDFSTTQTGSQPRGWRAKLANGGTTALVSTPGGLDGNWVELKGHSIHSTFKNQLPQNFTLTYDLVAAQHFTWGAKRLTMQLSHTTKSGNDESYLKLGLRPGFDGRDGEATLETRFPFPPGYSNGTKWYKATGFSNDKKYNRITVTIRKKEELLQVWVDKMKIAEYEKAIPLALPFNAISFDCSGNSAENDKYWISNIKITKD